MPLLVITLTTPIQLKQTVTNILQPHFHTGSDHHNDPSYERNKVCQRFKARYDVTSCVFKRLLSVIQTLVLKHLTSHYVVPTSWSDFFFENNIEAPISCIIEVVSIFLFKPNVLGFLNRMGKRWRFI